MKISVAVVSAAVMMTGCASTGTPNPEDPLEGWNRGVTGFNNVADKVVIGPLSQAYGTLIPGFARQGIDNALFNLGEPVTAVNSFLQGKPERGLDASWRFFVNSTVGVGGLFDPAKAMGLEPHNEDFGQTLAVWGVPEGPYLVMPLLGPSTVRDTAAFPIGSAINPLNYAQYGNDNAVNTGIRGGIGFLGALNTRYNLSDQLDALNEQPEPYTALRRIYLTQRRGAVLDGQEIEETFTDLPDFDDYEFDDE